MMLFDFKCGRDHVTEKLVKSDVKEITCPVCKNKALRQISAVRSKLDHISGDFPGATMKWARQREQQIKHERKTSE
jgi:hypothetical protein|tara:strand:+ start:8002 stop:8229 length:228 start_codon:yes stop_codon:yes gene_type:complete